MPQGRTFDGHMSLSMYPRMSRSKGINKRLKFSCFTSWIELMDDCLMNWFAFVP